MLLRESRRGVETRQGRTVVHAAPHGHNDGSVDGGCEEAGAADHRVDARRGPGDAGAEETDHGLSAARHGCGESEDWLEGAGTGLYHAVREHLHRGGARRNRSVLQVADRAEDDREDTGADGQEYPDYAAEDERVATAAQSDGAGFHEADGGGDGQDRARPDNTDGATTRKASAKIERSGA